MRVRLIAVLAIVTLIAPSCAWGQQKCPLPAGSYAASCQSCWSTECLQPNGALCCACETGGPDRSYKNACVEIRGCKSKIFLNDQGHLKCFGE